MWYIICMNETKTNTNTWENDMTINKGYENAFSNEDIYFDGDQVTYEHFSPEICSEDCPFFNDIKTCPLKDPGKCLNFPC